VHGGTRGCLRPLSECGCPDDDELDQADEQAGGEDGRSDGGLTASLER